MLDDLGVVSSSLFGVFGLFFGVDSLLQSSEPVLIFVYYHLQLSDTFFELSVLLLILLELRFVLSLLYKGLNTYSASNS